MSEFKPYQDESQSIAIGNLTIENRLDKVSLFGEIDLTKDKQGLARARLLQALLESVVASLEKVELPDTIPEPGIQKVSNPFQGS